MRHRMVKSENNSTPSLPSPGTGEENKGRRYFRKAPKAHRFGVLVILLGALLTPRPACADLFILSDGTRHEGTGVEDAGEFVITTYDGKVIRIKKNLLVGSKKDPQRNEYHARAGKLKPDDDAARYDLGLWAKEHALPEQAREQFLLVLKSDPCHEGAGKALGYAQKNGRWQPQAEESVEIRPAQKTPRPAALDRDAARKLAQRLASLSNLDTAEWEKSAEVQDLVAEARDRPELLAQVLKAPGLPGGANIAEGAVRAKAAALLTLGGDRRAMQPLLDACFQDPDDRVRQAAARCLPRLEEPIALRRLVDVAVSNKQNWPTRKLAAIAIRRYGDKEGVVRLLTELSFELAGGNALDPKNKPRAVISGPGSDNPMGMPLEQAPLGQPDETIIYPALSALKEVTGVAFDATDRGDIECLNG